MDHTSDLFRALQLQDELQCCYTGGLQILYELVTLLDVSVDQFFFPEREQEKSTRRRQLDPMLDGMSEKDLKILSATAKGIEEANNDETGE